VALWGTSTTSFFQGLGAITVDPTCVVGTVIETPVLGAGTEEDATLDKGVIAGIVVACVFVFLLVAGLTGFCCYKKHMHNKNKTGVEVVSVSKMRSERSEKKEERLSYHRASKVEDCPKVATEEEDISGEQNQGGNYPMTETDADMSKQQSRRDGNQAA